MPVKKPLKKASKAAKQTYLCMEIRGPQHPETLWVLLDRETDIAWRAHPLSNLDGAGLEYPKSDWQESKLPSRAKRALSATWQAIGPDALACGGENPETTVWDAEDVRDMVSSCGFIGGYPEMYGNDKEAVAWLELQPEVIQDLLLAQAFPPGRYGL